MFLILILCLQLLAILVIGLVFYKIRKMADEWQKTFPGFTGNINDDYESSLFNDGIYPYGMDRDSFCGLD